MIVTIYVFTYFGGFTTGKSLDVNEFKAYAKSVDQISTPQEYNIIALGEATHGNKEFQQLKLEVFKKLVEEHRVHSFALEGDFGGCEEVNQYIHGGEGTLKEIVQKIGFQIYKTEEMMQLIEYIREYNDEEEEQLNFYGFDMQRIRYSFDALKKECIAEGVNLSFLDNFIIDGQWNQNYSYEEKKDLLMKLKKTLEAIEDRIIIEQRKLPVDYQVQAMELKYQRPVQQRYVRNDIKIYSGNTHIRNVSDMLTMIDNIEIRQGMLEISGKAFFVGLPDTENVQVYIAVKNTYAQCEIQYEEEDNSNWIGKFRQVICYKGHLPITDEIIGRKIQICTAYQGYMIKRKKYGYDEQCVLDGQEKTYQNNGILIFGDRRGIQLDYEQKEIANE